MRLLYGFVLSGDYHSIEHTRLVTTEFDRRIRHKTKGYNLGVYFETHRGTAIGLSGTVDKMSYEDVFSPQSTRNLSQVLDREEKRGSIEFYYRVFSDSFLFLKGGYSEYNFESPDFRWRNSYSYEINGGIRFPFMGNTRGTLSLGYMKFIPRKEERKSFSGFIGNTDLDIRYRRLGFRFSFHRGPQFSYLSDAYYFVAGNYRAGISYYLLSSVRIDYDYTYGRMNYPEPFYLNITEGGSEEIYRKDRHHTHSAGLVFRIFENTGLGLTFNSWRRNSNYPGISRGKNYIGIYVTYEF